MCSDDFSGTTDEYSARMGAEAAAKASSKFNDEMCEHMRALVQYCEAVGVIFGGCGDCGSPWLTCSHCEQTVDDAAEVFARSEKAAS